MQYIAPVDPKVIVSRWSEIQPFIEMGLEFNHEDLQPVDVLQALTAGHMHLLAATTDAFELKAVVLTEVIEYVNMRALRVIIIAGIDREEWDQHIDALVDRWAQVCGTKRIEALCRKGMSKALKPYGYSQAYVVMVKPVDSLH